MELIKQQDAESRYDEIKKFVAGTAAAAGLNGSPAREWHLRTAHRSSPSDTCLVLELPHT